MRINTKLKLRSALLALVLPLIVSVTPVKAVLAQTGPLPVADVAAETTLGTIDGILVSIYTAIGTMDASNMARMQLMMQSLQDMFQGEIDTQTLTGRTATLANIASQHVVSVSDNTCANGTRQLASEKTEAARKTAAPQFTHVALNFGSGGGVATGPQGGGGDTSSGGFAATFISSLCNLGLFDKAYVNNDQWLSYVKNCPVVTGPLAIYNGAASNLDIVFSPIHTTRSTLNPDALEYVFPSNISMTPDGIPTLNKSNAALSDDQVGWMAAFYSIINNMPVLRAPSPGTKPTVASIKEANLRIKNLAMISGPVSGAVNALLYRTAYPSGSNDATIQHYHDLQVDNCNILQAPAGYKLTLKSDGTTATGLGLDPTEPSLANCQTNGLADAEYDRLRLTAYKYSNFQENIYGIYPPEGANHLLTFEMPNEYRDWQQHLENNQAQITSGLQAANQITYDSTINKTDQLQ